MGIGQVVDNLDEVSLDLEQAPHVVHLVEDGIAVPTRVLTKEVLDAGKEPMLEFVK